MDIIPFSVVLKNMCDELVFNIGLGYTESIYQNALKLLLRKNNYDYQEEVVYPIVFKNEQIGFVRLDLIINNNIIIELKAIQKIGDKEENQVKRYKNLTGIKEAYIINFNIKDYSITRY